MPIDLAAWGMPDCDLLVSPDDVFPTVTSQVSPGAGAATIEINIPPDASLAGTQHFAQWLAATNGSALPGASTRGLRFIIQQ